jgi:uncharacterized protein (TIGR02217 family)
MLNEVCPLPVGSWKSGRRFMTTVTVGKNGQEQRNREWQDPLRVFNAIFTVKREADAVALFDFHQRVGGRHESFLVKDYFDFDTEWLTFPTVSVGGTESRQLFKTYHEGVNSFNRSLKYIKPNAVQMKEDGQLMAPASVTVNDTTGVVTFSSAAESVITFKVDEYYIPARFDVDEISLQMLYFWIEAEKKRMGIQFPEIPIIEVRE